MGPACGAGAGGGGAGGPSAQSCRVAPARSEKAQQCQQPCAWTQAEGQENELAPGVRAGAALKVGGAGLRAEAG